MLPVVPLKLWEKVAATIAVDRRLPAMIPASSRIDLANQAAQIANARR
jgi:hypothetical protein